MHTVAGLVVGGEEFHLEQGVVAGGPTSGARCG